MKKLNTGLLLAGALALTVAAGGELAIGAPATLGPAPATPESIVQIQSKKKKGKSRRETCDASGCFSRCAGRGTRCIQRCQDRCK